MPQPRTVSRPIQSCFQCRKRKIRCNRAVPCAPCLLRGEGDSCQIIAKSVGPAVPPEAVNEVLNRVVALERSISKLSKLIASESTPHFSSTESYHHFSPPNKTPQLDTGTVSPHVRSLYEEAALTLAEISMENRENRYRAPSQLAPGTNLGNFTQSFSRAVEMFATPLHDAVELPSPSSRILPATSSLPEEHPLALLVQSSTSVVAQILSHLPNESCSRALVRFYFDRFDWYTRIFHYPTFSSEADLLLKQVAGFSTVSSLSTSTPASISLPFLSTYFMVLCLTYHLIEPDMSRVMNISFEQAVDMSRKMFSAAQLCLWIDNYLENHSLESVQTLILMGIYQQDLGDSDSHWALLGSAIKIAQNLGLDRLGSESDKRADTGPWKSPVKREIGRRVWWNLIYSDWSNAAAHNGAYAIIPSQNNTVLPMNIDDLTLKDDQPLRPAPLSQYTEMTYSSTRFRFVEIYRQIIDSVEHHPMGFRHNTIAEIDSRLSTMLKDLPSAFQVAAPSSSSLKGIKTLEYTMSLIVGESLRMRLHRPFLFRGYREERYGPSKQQCVASARAILKYIRYDPTMTTTLLRRWSVMFFGFAASIILLIDFCHRRGVGAIEEGRRELRSSLNMFRAVQTLSPVSRNVISHLEGVICTAEQNLASMRRRADHDHRKEVAKQAIANGNTIGKPGSQQLTPLLPSLLVPNVPMARPAPVSSTA